MSLESIFLMLFLSAWYGAPNLGLGVLAAWSRRYVGPTLVVFAGTLLLGAVATWLLAEEMRPKPPGYRNCGPPMVLVWPVAHWLGVAVTSIVAATAFAMGRLPIFKRAKS